MRTFILIIMVLFVSAGVAGAEAGGTDETKKEVKRHIYEWTDDKGNVHITDDSGEVPERYRAKTRTIEMPRGQEVSPSQEAGNASSEEGSAGEQEAASKAAWQQRLRDGKKKLADAQKSYHELEQKRQESLGQWGGPASGHLEGRAEADRIAQEMEAVQKKIDEARDMVEKVIPEEARRAGIPPGWLRE